MKLQLTATVDYTLNGTRVAFLKDMLTALIHDAYGNGELTGITDAEVEKYHVDVREIEDEKSHNPNWPWWVVIGHTPDKEDETLITRAKDGQAAVELFAIAILETAWEEDWSEKGMAYISKVVRGSGTEKPTIIES